MKTCKANSCPLPAEFITHWAVDDDGVRRPKWGVCHYHRMTKPENWVQTTSRIQMHYGIALVLRGLASISDPIFSPKENESFQAWHLRADASLRDLILGPGQRVDATANFAKIISLLSE